MERIENFATNPFLSGPAEFLAEAIAENLRCIPQFKLIFGDQIDSYCRMDYSMRSLPALRIFNEHYVKDYESWFIVGEIFADVIFPASLRREDLQRLPDIISSAIVQQFRRPQFFLDVEAKVPALNELGKTVNVDKSLGYKWEKDSVPLTRIVLNFRIDLRVWDQYLEDHGRTKDDPFEVTLEDLKSIVTTIQGLRDDGTVNVTEALIVET